VSRRLIPDRIVWKERYRVSRMTGYRWDKDPDLNFPKPIRIRKRKYRDEDELDAFDAARRAASARAPDDSWPRSPRASKTPTQNKTTSQEISASASLTSPLTSSA
jgi:hypothetical protein